MRKTYTRSCPTCGARNRQGQPCAKPAGWGTDHNGEGRCRLHGGKGGRPIKHGRNSKYEVLFLKGILREVTGGAPARFETNTGKILDSNLRLIGPISPEPS